MKKIKKLLLLATVTTLAYTTVGCGVLDSITETIDERVEDTLLETAWDKIKGLLGIEEEEVVIEPEESAEETPVEEDGQLSEDSLKEFADYFNAKEHNGLLISDYHNPEEIDWGWAVLSCGIGYNVESGSDEYEAYCNFSGYDFKKPVNCIPRTELEEYVRTNTGTDYAAAKKPLEEAFIEKYDSYYIYHSDVLYKTYRFTEGTKEDDVYTLTYESTGEAEVEEGENSSKAGSG